MNVVVIDHPILPFQFSYIKTGCHDLIAHIRQGDKITKKGSYVFICVFIIGCTALIVSDCLLQDCLQDV